LAPHRARGQEGHGGADGPSDERVHRAPYGTEEHPGGEIEGQPRHEEGGTDGVEEDEHHRSPRTHAGHEALNLGHRETLAPDEATDAAGEEPREQDEPLHYDAARAGHAR